MQKGDIFQTTKSGPIEIIKYHNNKKIEIEFKRSGIRKITRATHIRAGKVCDLEYNTEKIEVDKIFESKMNGPAKVIEYKNSNNVVIQFLDTGFIKKCQASHLRAGIVKDPYRQSVCGVGFFGYGPYLSSLNGAPTDVYIRWQHMIERCYSGREIHASYRGVTVCAGWHNFQNFARWYEQNYPRDGGVYELDKDIKNPKARRYAPENCQFVTVFENRSESTRRRYANV